MKASRSFHPIVRSGAWAFSGKVAAALTMLGLNALLSRVLPPDKMGVYFLVVSITYIGAQVAQIGLSQAVLRLVAEALSTGKPGRARRFVTLSVGLCACNAAALSLVLLGGAGRLMAEGFFDAPELAANIDVVTAWLVVQVILLLIAEVYRGFNDIRLASVFGGMTSGILNLVLVSVCVLIRPGTGLRTILVLSTAASAVALGLSCCALVRKLRELPRRPEEPVRILDVLSLTWPLWISVLTYVVITRLDIWIVGMLRPSSEVAIYGAAARLISLITFPLMIANAVTPPLVAGLFAQGKTAELERSIRCVATVVGLPSSLVLLGVLAFGEKILGLIFGSYYGQGALALGILAVGQLGNIMAGACSYVINLTGHQRQGMRIVLWSSVLAVGASVVLGHIWGGAGVAAAFSGGLLLQNGLSICYCIRRLNVNPTMFLDMRELRRAIRLVGK